MEKFFTPNKWFVGFCALLIIVVGALKLVGDMHLAELASEDAKDMFNWEWSSIGEGSRIAGLKSHVVRRDANDAVVEVSGIQTVVKLGQNNTIEKESAITPEAKVLLTYYRRNSKWVLGKVELK